MKRRIFLHSLVAHPLFASVAIALPLPDSISDPWPRFNPVKAAQALNLVAIKMKEHSPPELWNAPDNDERILLALWQCDKESYVQHGESISTFTYLKMPEGPLPDPAQLKQAIEVLNKADL